MKDNTKEKLKQWLGEDNQIGMDIWEKKYRYNNESFDEWLDRVSGGDEDIKGLILSKKFLFAGRILSNRGTQVDGRKVTYSNCYVVPPPEDSLESIFDCAKGLARTFSYGGGCGIDISKLSPKGAHINNAAKETSGAISFMDLYSLTTELIGQNGRRGALMISISCDHPDIEDFITIKSDLDKITKANLSIRVTDEFMRAVENDSTYTLSFTREETGEEIKKTIKAKELFDKFCYMNWDYGEPAFLFWDRVRSYNLLSEDDAFEYAGVNPCLSGNTLIQTANGNIPIKDLVGTTPDVYCMNNDGELAIAKATKVWCTRKDAQTVTVHTGKGDITCTPDHLIFTTNRGWVEAKSLRKGDKIKGLNRQMKDEVHVAVGLSGAKYIPEHRFVLGYYEDIEGMDVHHIDGNTFNNKHENLQAMSHSEHSRLTNTGRVIEYNRDETNGRFLPKAVKSKRASKNQKKQVGSNWYVKDVSWNTETEDVYDITVPEFHNFVANDMVVHNCAEEPLPSGGSCLLGSLNLAAFVETTNGQPQFNMSEFRKAVSIAVYGLNDVLDEGLPLHPLEVQRDSVRDWRQIGLGIMGLADMLIKLGITYGSQESLDICDDIGWNLANKALSTSMAIAKSKGEYPMFSDEVWGSDFYKKHIGVSGTLRNSQLLTIAPTGTLSTMLGISGGVEPIFANYYTRRTESLHGEEKEYKIFTPIAWEYLQSHGYGEDETKLPSYFITSADIPYRNRIDMQAVWQKHIDASISSTVNLPNSATVDDVKDLYLYAWKQGLKGITVFRDGCKRLGILTTDNKEPDKKNDTSNKFGTFGRGDIINVDDDLVGYKRKIVNGCGDFSEQIFFDDFTGEPLENYIAMGDGGGCSRNLEAISRLISLALRGGIHISEVIKQLKKVHSCPAYRARKIQKGDTSIGTSCPSAIGYAIEELCNKINDNLFDSTEADDSSIFDDSNHIIIESCYEDNESEEDLTTKPTCPECGEPLVFEGGCNICKACGWSKCD